MKKLILIASIYLLVSVLNGQVFSRYDITSNMSSLGLQPDNMNHFALDGADVWMVPGQSWPNFRYFSTNGILRWNGSSLKHYSQNNLKLANDSVFRVLRRKSDILALTAAGIERLEGDTFRDFSGISNLPTQKVYDLLDYGSRLYLATDKGLCIQSATGTTLYNTSNGLPESNCFSLIPINGRVYGLTYSYVFEYDTATAQFDTVYKAKLAGSRIFLAAYNGFLAISNTFLADSFRYKLAFYKNGALFNLKQVTARCGQHFFEGGLQPGTAIAMHSGDNRLLVHVAGSRLLFADQNGARDYSSHPTEVQGYLGADEMVICAVENNRIILLRGDYQGVESYFGQEYTPQARLEANNLMMVAGSANFNSSLGLKNTFIKSRECRSTLFARSLWVGGQDDTGGIHLAATTYLQRGNDFYPGPLNLNGTKKPEWSTKYNRLWNIKAATIATHNEDFLKNGKVNNVSLAIAEWPVYEVDGTDTIWLAPFVDKNKNGFYDPTNGDYPKIRGDEALFVVFNDSGVHTETQGKALLTQVKALLWAVHCPVWSSTDTLGIYDNTVFVEYELTNRSAKDYNNVYLGQWNDLDMGNYADDYVGCLPTENVVFGYNGDNNDEGWFNGFGENPPVQNMLFLEGPLADGDGLDNDNDGIVDNISEQCLMGSFMTYANDSDPERGNPENSTEFYNLLRARWLRGTPVMHNSDTVRFMFSHGEDPDHPAKYWTEFTGSWIPRDNRFVSAAGPFVWKSGETVRQTLAYHYMEAPYQKDPASQVKRAANIIRKVYDREGWKDCQIAWLGTEEMLAEKRGLAIYPVPSGNAITLSLTGYSGKALVGIYDVQGRKLLFDCDQVFESGKSAMDITNLSAGVYFVKLECQGKTYSLSILKE